MAKVAAEPNSTVSFMRPGAIIGLAVAGSAIAGFFFWKTSDIRTFIAAAAPASSRASRVSSEYVSVRSGAELVAPHSTNQHGAPEQGRLLPLGPEVVRSAEYLRLQQLVSAAVRELEGSARAGRLVQLGTAMASLPIVEILELIETTQALRDRQVLVNAALDKLFQADPLQAAELAAQLKEPLLRADAYQAIGAKWAAQDLGAARAWALSLDDTLARNNAAEGIAWKWMQSDQRAAYAWATSLDDAALRDQVFLKMSKVVAAQNPVQALEWAMQFPIGATREEAITYALSRLADADLKGAVDWVARVGDPALRMEAEVAIARSWANFEPQGATGWAAEIKDPPSRAAALQATLFKWAESQPANAATWLADRPYLGGEELFTTVTQTLAQSQLPAAERWVANTKNPAWRTVGEAIVAQLRAKLPAK